MENNEHLLNECNTGFEIHAEVNELPLNAFLLVLFLLEDEHVVVEELLQTLVGVVDAQLLERVVLETNIIIIIIIIINSAIIVTSCMVMRNATATVSNPI